MEANIFKNVPEDLSERNVKLTKDYDETFNLIEDLEQELTEVRIEIAKIEVEDILKKEFSLFYSDFLEETDSLEAAEKIELLMLAYLKIIRSIGIELNFLNELSIVLNEKLTAEETVPTDLKQLVNFTNVLDYKYNSMK